MYQQNPQNIIFEIYKSLSPLVIELQEKKYTKYLASKIGGNITTILNLLVNSKYCRLNKDDYSNKIEYLQQIQEFASKITDETKALLSGSYFTQRGGNEQNKKTFMKINEYFFNIFQKLDKNLEISVLPFIQGDVNNSNDDLYKKIDDGLINAESKQDKSIKLMNEINNDLCYIIWIEYNTQKLTEIQVNDFLEVFKSYDDSFQNLQSAEKNIEDLLNTNGLNSWKNYADFINYVWANPEQKNRLFQTKPIKIDNKILELEVIRKTSQNSNFAPNQVFLIGQNGLISDDQIDGISSIISQNNNNNQRQNKKILNHGLVTFGRDHPSYPVPNDIQFNAQEEKISRRQMTIRHNDEKGKYELVCTSLVNFTEFVMTSRYKYPIFEGSIIGIKDLIFFEVKSLKPNKQQEKLDKNYSGSQNKVSDYKKELTQRIYEPTTSINCNDLIHKFENQGDQTQNQFQASEFSCKRVVNDIDITQKRKDNENDDDSDLEYDEDEQDTDQEEQKGDSQANKKKPLNPTTEFDNYSVQRNRIIEQNNKLQQQKKENNHYITIEVQFSRKQITSPKKPQSFTLQKTAVIIGHKSGLVDIPIDSDQLQNVNQFFIFMDENNNWYITAPFTADVSYQLKLSSAEKESSRPFQLKQYEIIQVQDTRLQINFRNKQQQQQQQQK